MSAQDSLRYPIGKFTYQKEYEVKDIYKWVKDIITLPGKLAALTDQLTDADFEKTYREGSWTVRQVIHHLADSHIHAYIRFKFGLLEDRPQVMAYDENAWADSADVSLHPEFNIQLLSGIHRKWGKMLNTMSAEDFKRVILHPERGEVALDHILQLYAWHGEHHLAQIASIFE